MKLTYDDKLVLHTALMEYLSDLIGDPSAPDEQVPELVAAYVNARYSYHGLSFKSLKFISVSDNRMRAKALLRAIADEPCELEQPT